MDLGLASPGRIPHPELFTSLAGVDQGLRCWPEVLGNQEVAAEGPGTLHVVLQGSSVGSPCTLRSSALSACSSWKP